jgi:hypothetical protein
MYVDIYAKYPLFWPVITKIVSTNFGGASVGAVGWGTAPLDWKFRVRFPVMSLEFSSDQFLLSAFQYPLST